MRHRLATVAAAIVVSAALASIVSSVVVMAGDGLWEDDGTPPVPYFGTLQRNGKPFGGVVQMDFRLYTAAEGGQPLWSETRVVHVYGGRFTALLGAGDPAAASALWRVIGQGPAYLEIGLLSGAEGGQQRQIQLANRQRFLPIPFTAESRGTSELALTGDLVLERSSLRFAAADGAGDGGRVIAAGEDDSLVLDPDGEFSGGTLVQGPLSTEGHLEVEGDLAVAGLLQLEMAVVRNEDGALSAVCPLGLSVIGGFGSCHDGSYAEAELNPNHVRVRCAGGASPDIIAFCGQVVGTMGNHCPWNGARRCSPEHPWIIQRCEPGGALDELRWTGFQDCSSSDKTCAPGQDGEPACTCVHSCADGESRCAGEQVQQCRANENGCRRWVTVRTCDDYLLKCGFDEGEQMYDCICDNRCPEVGALRCAISAIDGTPFIYRCEQTPPTNCLLWQYLRHCSNRCVSGGEDGAYCD